MARPKARRRSAARPLPGWVWMSFGLALGLIAAGLVYLGTDRGPVVPPAAPEAPVPGSAPRADSPIPPPQVDRAPDEERTEFDFYEMLPSFEVVVPEYESEPRVDRRDETLAEPGRYVLQVGSFKTYADADARAASLALIGIEARVQRVTIDDDVFHRVRIGPIDDLEQLNRIRRQLRDARIEALLMRVP
jgi:cell division protein FtsN